MSLKALRAAGAGDVISFRAPYSSMNRWHRLRHSPVLAGSGFRIDSSVFPLKLGYYGQRAAPNGPHRWGPLIEFHHPRSPRSRELACRSQADSMRGSFRGDVDARGSGPGVLAARDADVLRCIPGSSTPISPHIEAEQVPPTTATTSVSSGPSSSFGGSWSGGDGGRSVTPRLEGHLEVIRPGGEEPGGAPLERGGMRWDAIYTEETGTIAALWDRLTRANVRRRLRAHLRARRRPQRQNGAPTSAAAAGVISWKRCPGRGAGGVESTSRPRCWRLPVVWHMACQAGAHLPAQADLLSLKLEEQFDWVIANGPFDYRR